MDTNHTPAALTAALARLTQAVDELDAQISALPAPSATQNDPAADSAELSKRHDRLRSEVALVVNELEQMVADRG